MLVSKSCVLLLVAACLVIVAGATTTAGGDDTHGAIEPTWFTCLLADNRFAVVRGKDTSRGAAWGFFDDGIETKGYGILSIITSAHRSDDDQVRCAGYLEGYLTARRITQMYHNFKIGAFPNDTVFNEAYHFTEQTMAWTLSQVQRNKDTHSADAAYWNHVGLIMAQLDALTAGHNAASSLRDRLPMAALFMLNMVGDMDDLIPALEWKHLKEEGQAHEEIATDESYIVRALFNSHCSSIVKPSSDMKELFAAHEMWSGYYQMLGVYKSYAFNLRANGTVSQKVSFSSYPALLSSEDDFYILDSQLVVMETTNAVYNRSLYDAITPSTLMSWIRVIVSNRMASTGSEWVQVMPKYNSGTYNNQWIIVDYKLFTPGLQKLAPGTLWIGSQIPGYFESADVTSVVNNQGYWPSYNVPYFKDIYEKTGYGVLAKKYGDVYTYEHCPRANIFRQRQGSIQDVQTLQKFMRYNDFKKDPLSLGCPYYQIAARGDLADTNPPVPFCPRGAFGAINAKLTTSAWVRKRQASIIGGPTHEYLPPFEWTAELEKEFPTAAHEGQPRRFDFEWMDVTFA